MKHRFLIFLLLFICINSSAQIKFEKGYFIDTSSQRTECLIKNIDWKNNPVEFQYKISETDEARMADIKTVTEFGIYDFSKYIRADVKIDRSPSEIEDLTGNSQPQFLQEQLFLKVLVEGPASLYLYREKNLGRFFYKTENSPIEQLVYKEYLDANGNVRANNSFRSQLASKVICANSGSKPTTYLNYSQSEFIKYFRSYNECKGGVVAVENINKKRDFINLKIASGMDYSSLKYYSLYSSDFDFGKKLNFRVGLEAEFVLPFNKNKWRILLAPTFQYFNSTIYFNPQNSLSINNRHAAIKYKSLEFPLGIRHYFYLNDNVKIFLNFIYISNFSIDFNSVINIDNSEVLNLDSADSFAFGAGIEFKKLSAEFRNSTNRELLNDLVTRSTRYNRLSLILGYAIF